MADTSESQIIRFYDPDRRALVPFNNSIGNGVHIPRRLVRRVRQDKYDITINRNFFGVIQGCAKRTETRKDTWINHEIKKLYLTLHKMGFAHSVETWLDGELVGGLYGVAIRAAFFGESMFSIKTDASKVALVHLMARLYHGGYLFLDAQFLNDHLLQFGTIEVPRDEFHSLLSTALMQTADLNLEVSGNELMYQFLGKFFGVSSLS